MSAKLNFTCIYELSTQHQLISDMQKMLAKFNLRLHKVVSNPKNVMKSFPIHDLAKDAQKLELQGQLPNQLYTGTWKPMRSYSRYFKMKDYLPEEACHQSTQSLTPWDLLLPITLVDKLFLRNATELDARQNNS